MMEQWTYDSIIHSILHSHSRKDGIKDESSETTLANQLPPLSMLNHILATNGDSKIVFLVGCYIMTMYTSELVKPSGITGAIMFLLSWIPGVSMLLSSTSASSHNSVNSKSNLNQSKNSSSAGGESEHNLLNDALLQLNGKSLNAFGLNIMQKTYEAALDINQMDFATDALDFLKMNPNGEHSTRFKILLGMFFESVMDYDEAIAQYKEILEEKAFYKDAMKRIIAVTKSIGSTERAIKWLVHLVNIHPMEVDAHMELVDMYTTANQYACACIAAEELILLQPNNWTFHIKYADTLCRNNQFDLARKYYAKSFNLKENLRAALGLLMCLRYTQEDPNVDSKLKKLLELYVVDLYTQKKSPLAESVKNAILQQ